MAQPELKLKYFTYTELFDPLVLEKLDQKFLQELGQTQSQLLESLIAYRHENRKFTPLEISELLLASAPFVEDFIGELFGISDQIHALKALTLSHQPVFAFKQYYVLRQAKRRLNKLNEQKPFFELSQWLDAQLEQRTIHRNDFELAVASLGVHFLQAQEQYQQEIELLTQWCVRAMADSAGQAVVKGWVSFQLPQKLDYENLVPMIPVPNDPIARLEGPPSHHRMRDGFKLTDARMTERQALNEIDYCVYCHEHEGDFCSKGFPVKKGDPQQGLKVSPLGEVETGCPLEEKISEMHVLKKQGLGIASLAMVMVDNPMCPATGHRICNDCMKGCIYQKQDPVNIPQVETRVLTDVLNLPWGVEIYDLLTRWNPLRKDQWVAKPYNGLKVLVMGMGPAGFTLAHHLLMEGFAVVGVDGLKIEPLPEHLVKQPIYHFDTIKEELDERVMTGFGGVAEYGITVRWDKNFLKLIYISLLRRPYFQVFGGVRFGGTLKVEDAWELGFDHMAIAVGAGLPRELPIPGSLAPGMRQANDFLMALQLTGAAKKTSLANLQVRLPAVVIGGGLTGIDTATEVQAYYITQVEKTLERYEKLSEVYGEARVREHFDELSFAILNEFLLHGREVRAERKKAAQENRPVNFMPLIRAWGGVTIAYRGLLKDSPAYRRNHEEIIKAMEEGIYYAEGLTPKAVRVDQFGYVSALVSESRILNQEGKWETSDEEHVLAARSIFVATGAKPNIAYEFEHRGTFHREGHEYQAYDANGELKVVHPHGHCKIEEFGAFTSYQKQEYRVSFLGDTHPVFHGSVVKAIASAKRAYPKIVHTFHARSQALGDSREYHLFAEKIDELFSATIVNIQRHGPEVIELVVHAPLATKNYAPGHFYRIQNFESSSVFVDDTLLQTEAVAALGTKVDPKTGNISLMIVERGASSRLFATFKSGQPIALMGPTGVKTKIPTDKETIVFFGGRLGAAHLLAIGPALRQAGNRVLFIANFPTVADVFCQKDLEASADKIIWVTQTGEPIQTSRPQDRALTADYMEAIAQYAAGKLDAPEGAEIPFQEVNRIFVIGSYQLLRDIQKARQTTLKDYFIKNPLSIGSVYGPMQCMLKGVCAQCLTWQIDPATGERTKAVFACSWHDQPLEMIDLGNLEERLSQNRAQEILTDLWLDYLLAHYHIPRI